MKMRFLLLWVCLMVPLLLRADPVLRPNDVVAICGDSITQRKVYSIYIEDYLLRDCGAKGL